MAPKVPLKTKLAAKAATAAVATKTKAAAARAAKILPPEAYALSSLARGAIIANMISFLIILILFLWTAASKVFDAQAKEDQNARWWDSGLIFQEELTLKVVENMAFLVVASGLLFVPMKNVWHATKGVYDRFNFGVLVAYMFMFGNMFFVSFWYLVNMGNQKYQNVNQANNAEYNDGNNNKKNKNYEYAEQQENQASTLNELALHHRAVTATLCFLMAATFCTLSYFLYKEAKKLPEKGHGSNTGFANENARIKGLAHMEIFMSSWTYLTYITIFIFVGFYICTCILLSGQQMAVLRQEGLMFNLISVLGWVIILTAGMMYAGRKILRQNRMEGTLGVGVMQGGTAGYALFLLLVCILYADPALKEHKNGADGAAPAIATSFACFFFFLMYTAFALGWNKYQTSIIGAALENVDLDAGGDVERGESGGDFARMDDDSAVMVDDSSADDFQRMEDDEPVMVDNSSMASSQTKSEMNADSGTFQITDSKDSGTGSKAENADPGPSKIIGEEPVIV